MADSTLVLVDTDIWSRLFTSTRPVPEVDVWRRLLLGKVIAIAQQTVGEVRFGARRKNWGGRRLEGIEQQLARTVVVPVTEDVVNVWVDLRVACEVSGHALAAKEHMGDAWVAASAIGHALPLLANDGIYRRAPGLRLFDG